MSCYRDVFLACGGTSVLIDSTNKVTAEPAVCGTVHIAVLHCAAKMSGCCVTIMQQVGRVK